MAKDQPSFHSKTSGFGIGTSFLPDIDIAGDDCSSFLCVEATGGDWQDVSCYGVEYLEGISGGADAHVSQGGFLHGWRSAGESWE